MENYINWTKVHGLNHQNGSFKLYVSSHTDGYFYGAVLYYEKSGAWSADNNVINVNMKLEQFVNRSEESVYQQCIDWINNNLPGKYTIELIETKEN